MDIASIAQTAITLIVLVVLLINTFGRGEKDIIGIKELVNTLFTKSEVSTKELMALQVALIKDYVTKQEFQNYREMVRKDIDALEAQMKIIERLEERIINIGNTMERLETQFDVSIDNHIKNCTARYNRGGEADHK